MGNINISDLRPAGVDLFLDTESYLNDLTEGEMMNTRGKCIIISNRICIFTGSFTCPHITTTTKTTTTTRTR